MADLSSGGAQPLRPVWILRRLSRYMPRPVHMYVVLVTLPYPIGTMNRYTYYVV